MDEIIQTLNRLERTLKRYQPEYFTLKQAAEYTGLSVKTLRRLIHAGSLQFARIGESEKSIIILSKSDIDKFINSRKAKSWKDWE